ncbi:hypothetical protein LWI28_011388 [Acer negundo]|uniref:Uncharacterized protein n=1 Tax=Acer negundo TaxID=4023 RepID=A0AAD5IM93_ACENE|nr:hypothetical protein LWI28_011388 [Acer negundo]
MANFIAFASSHESKEVDDEEERSQEENDLSNDDSSSHSTNRNVESMDLKDYLTKLKTINHEEEVDVVDDIPLEKVGETPIVEKLSQDE